MTPQPMLITPQCHAFQEGNESDFRTAWILLNVQMQLSYSTMKILGIATISRADHSVAQTRELECTKVAVPQVIDRGQLQHNYCNDVYKYSTVYTQA